MIKPSQKLLDSGIHHENLNTYIQHLGYCFTVKDNNRNDKLLKINAVKDTTSKPNDNAARAMMLPLSQIGKSTFVDVYIKSVFL